MKNVYSVYDVELKSYNFPFPADKDLIAKRIFNQYIEKSGGLFNFENLKLYKVGEYDEDLGKIIYYDDFEIL